MTTEAELLAAIAADPSDDARLVYADWLLARNDPRGKLIVLDCVDRTTPGGLTDPEALTELLRLAAEHGFPHLPDPDAHQLAWERTDTGFVAHAFTATFGAHRYAVAYEGTGHVALALDGAPIGRVRTVAKPRLSDDDTNVILSIASHAIRGGLPLALTFPTTEAEIRAHADYRPGPYPRYSSHELAVDLGRPDWTLRARDYSRWYTLWHRVFGTAHDY